MLPPALVLRKLVKAPPTETLPAVRLTDALPPIVPPPLPSFRFEIPKVASFRPVRAPPISKVRLTLELIDPALRLLTSASMEFAVRAPPVATEIFPPVPMRPPPLLSTVSDRSPPPLMVRFPPAFSAMLAPVLRLPLTELSTLTMRLLPAVRSVPALSKTLRPDEAPPNLRLISTPLVIEI